MYSNNDLINRFLEGYMLVNFDDMYELKPEYKKKKIEDEIRLTQSNIEECNELSDLWLKRRSENKKQLKELKEKLAELEKNK